LTLEPFQAPGERGDAAPIELVCDRPDLPCDGRNLVVRVATVFDELSRAAWGDDGPPLSDQGAAAVKHLIAAKAGSELVGGNERAALGIGEDAEVTRLRGSRLRAVLQKQIPVGAGLGGGSSDAARTLLGLNRLYRAGRAVDDLSAFAARFGSDLSFFLYGPSSICTGRGEVVRPIPRPAARWALLVLPPIVMPTPDVYRKFDAMGLGVDRDVTEEPDWQQWATLGAADLLPRLVNDLEPPAFALRPDLDELRRSIEQKVGRPVRMSGSGSSLFTLFDTEEEARQARVLASSIEGSTRPTYEVVELAPDIVDDLAE
jgi:4-diphosphocytidyl-2C-methyl-D-erythritol kinase